MERTFVRKILTQTDVRVIIYPEQKMTRLTNGVGSPRRVITYIMIAD